MSNGDRSGLYGEESDSGDADAAEDVDEEEKQSGGGTSEATIDGFPVDCGTQKHFYLSRTKCTAAAILAHPHTEFTATKSEEEDEEQKVDGDASAEDTWVKPVELWRTTGQHNLGCPESCSVMPCPTQTTLAKWNCYAFACWREDGFIEDYGIGIALYFKFLQTMSTSFFFISFFACFAIGYYWGTSPWDSVEKAALIESGGVATRLFFTTAGALGGQGFVCGSGIEGDRLSLSCPQGVITKVEAYYGNPFGSCTCPSSQALVPSTGKCPGSPDYTTFRSGECTELYTEAGEKARVEQYGDAVAAGKPKPCFKGSMWNSDVCCSASIDSKTKAPIFDELAVLPDPGCNSGSAQFIAQAVCLNQPSCTLDVTTNVTFSWEITPNAPCNGGGEAMSELDDKGRAVLKCYASFETAYSNFVNCTESSALSSLSSSSSRSSSGPRQQRRLLVRGQCGEASFSMPWARWAGTQTRALWAWWCAFLDACLTLALFVVVLWLKHKEVTAITDQDRERCRADDYTVRVYKLPKLKEGRAPDLDALRASLHNHFETFANSLPPLVPGRPVDAPIRVVDINFGLNNQRTIKLMKLRGTLARMLDLEVRMSSNHSSFFIHTIHSSHVLFV
jgi:hypothetical protein